MTEPVWFGAADRPSFGWLHVPDDGTARAGVVLCPPLGYEYVCAHRTIRHLAEALAAAGFCVLRVDYDGTGDSSGDHDDPRRVRAWIETVEGIWVNPEHIVEARLVELSSPPGRRE